MFVFRKIWRALFSWNTRSEIRPFALIPTNFSLVLLITGLLIKKAFTEKYGPEKNSVFGSFLRSGEAVIGKQVFCKTAAEV